MEYEEFQGIAKRKLSLSSTDQIFMDLPILRNLNSLPHLAQIGRIYYMLYHSSLW